MLLLLYCMAEKRPDAPIPPRGVRGAPVEVTQHSGLACYFSRYEEFRGGTADELKQDALDFHWTINHVFEQQTVVPFRFPTLLSGSPALEDFLREHAAAYRADLKRLRDRVQMEVRAPVKASEAAASAASGTAYLKARFDAAQEATALESLLRQAAPHAEWKQRANRYFALITRGGEQPFRDAIAALGRSDLRVSGPWPPTEFVNCYPDLPQNQS